MLNCLFEIISKLAQSDTAKRVIEVATSDTGKNIAKVAGGVVAGGVAVGTAVHIADKEHEKEESKNKFQEGYTAGEENTKQKFKKILDDVRSRDEFLLLITKIGVYIAKCDGIFSSEEIKALNNFIGKVNSSPVIPHVIKERIRKIEQTQISYDNIVSETKSYLNQYGYKSENEILSFIDKLIYEIVTADGFVHPAEQEFMDNWRNDFFK